MKESILRYGIIVGVVISAYMALLYAAGMDVFANWWYSVIMYPISIGLICYFTIQLRNKHESEPFQLKQTFIILLSMLMLATLISTIWNIVLFNVIDKSLAKELSVRILEETEKTMEKWGAPEEAIKETLKEMKDLPSQFKPGAQLLSWLKGGLFMALISVVCASFIKRKEQKNPFITA
jgi:amino acid transporter